MSSSRRALLVLAGAASFGAAMSLIHGSEGGLRAEIGNLSAPWLLLAFAAGATLGRKSLGRAAGAGLLATVFALFAFYAANVYVLDLTGHGALGDLAFAMRSGAYFVRLGLLSGPVMGVVGELWHRRKSLGIALATAGLLVFEPAAWLAYLRGDVSPPRDFLTVAVAEMVAGVVLAGALVRQRRRSLSP